MIVPGVICCVLLCVVDEGGELDWSLERGVDGQPQ